MVRFVQSTKSQQNISLLVKVACKILKATNLPYPPRSVLPVNDLSPGVKNGKKYGMRLSIVRTNAVESHKLQATGYKERVESLKLQAAGYKKLDIRIKISS